MAFNSESGLITFKEVERSHRGLQALFGFLGEAAKNDNSLLVCFLGTFSASLCRLNRAQMSNEGSGGFPFSIAAVKVLCLLFTTSCLTVAEVGTNTKIKLMDNFYDFINMRFSFDHGCKGLLNKRGLQVASGALKLSPI